ncbi:hypothetical protein SAMN05192583_0543 [Sphingomonas gellani]|uniref:Uncharacterized protein n=1 Tax=Sphingomonas gellani TaxID=1166340 RepID=A0A1H7Z5F2_9SPHN|nr:hypothetical protein SAMN05192583_0543 [Sphingomonas gellani]
MAQQGGRLVFGLRPWGAQIGFCGGLGVGGEGFFILGPVGYAGVHGCSEVFGLACLSVFV